MIRNDVSSSKTLERRSGNGTGESLTILAKSDALRCFSLIGDSNAARPTVTRNSGSSVLRVRIPASVCSSNKFLNRALTASRFKCSPDTLCKLLEASPAEREANGKREHCPLDIPLCVLRVWATPPADLGPRFGENLRRCRKEGGLSQSETALRAGLDRTAISLLERGQRVPRIDTVARLADVLGVPAGALLEGFGRELGGAKEKRANRR